MAGAMAEATRQIGDSAAAFYQWRQEFGGQKIEQGKQLKDLKLFSLLEADDSLRNGTGQFVGDQLRKRPFSR